MSLTVEQLAAVRSDAAALAIVAGAGTGKTSTIVARVERLIATGLPPDRILVTTFTKAAATELTERIDAPHPPMVSTVHSLCARIIRDYPALAERAPGFSIYDEHDQEAVIRDAARDMGVKKWDTARRTTLERNDKLMATYRDRLRQANAIDYDQLETLALRVLDAGPCSWHGRFEHVLIDESQDISQQQWLILRQLGAHTCLVADPRQSIYRWRGGDSRVFVDFCRTADEIASLTRNWRSGTPIVGLANQLHAKHPPLVGKGEATVATRVVADEPAYVASTIASLVERGHAPSSIALIGRTWRSLYRVATAVREQGVRVDVLSAQQDRWESPTGRALSRWLRLHVNPFDDNLAVLLARLLHHDVDAAALRGAARRARQPVSALLQADGTIPELWDDGDVQMAAALITARLPNPELAESLRLSLLRFRTLASFNSWWLFGRTSQDRLARLPEDVVPALTVHGAKGLEWPTVIVVGARDGMFPLRSAQTEEERNCLYVACTRAQERLLLVRQRTLEGRNGPYPSRPSPFLP